MSITISNIFANVWGELNKAVRENRLTVELPRAELKVVLEHAQRGRAEYTVCNAYGDEIATFPYTFPGLSDAIDYIIARYKTGKFRGDYIINLDGVDDGSPSGLTDEEKEYIEQFSSVSGM